MPLLRGKDAFGAYFRWGAGGTKYYYSPKNKISRERAKANALRQGRAIELKRR